MESIVFDNRIYSRIPESKNKSRQLYFKRKRYDRATKKRVWVLLHHIIWEKYNGPIPPNHIIVFIDGDPKNIDISNLAAVLRSEHLKQFRVKRK